MTRLHPRVGGVFHSAICAWGPVTYSFNERGCKEASWSIGLAPGERHPALVRGALVEIMDGSACIWVGELAEPNWREGRMTADGLAVVASRYPSLDGSGNSSSNPTTVANANITRGWKILSVASSVPNASYTTTADGSNDQTALFQANSDELAQRWYVGADRVLRFAADPTVPTLHIRPKVVDLGNADDEYASDVFVRYRPTSSTYATQAVADTAVRARFGFRGFMFDATPLGVINATRATNIGQGLLAKGRARLGWTSSIQVTSNELLTAGGVPVDLSMVTGGQDLLRIWVGYDDVQYLDGRSYLDILIGESTYTDGSGVISLAPLGKVAETMEEIAEETARGLVA